MLDIEFIRQHSKEVKKAASQKQMDPAVVDKVLDLDKKRRDLIFQVDQWREKRNEASQTRNIKAGKKIKQTLKQLEPRLKELEKEYYQAMLTIPNIPHSGAPIGQNEKDNVEVEKWGEKPHFDFEPQSHIELGKKLDLLDLERGVKTAGFRGYYLKNAAAQLHFAVLLYAWQKIIAHGFTPMVPPTILREFALVGSGHFPFGREDVYQIANPGKLADGKVIDEKNFLAGTAEPSLLAYFADQVLSEKDLPIKVCGWTPCYRSEAGSYGKDTKGLYRIHEFAKVEQVVLCRADEKVSNQWLEKMRKYSQEILEDLKLPYRVIEICTGDMGAGKRKMYDIETWMPSRHAYSETHSDSSLTDWQTRRLNIQYKNKAGEKVYAYALNNTVLASPRILIPILENYQQKDGSIKVPEVLKSLVGKEVIRPKK